MGLGSSSTRRINIENPEPRPNTATDSKEKDIPISESTAESFSERKVSKRKLPSLSTFSILDDNVLNYRRALLKKNRDSSATGLDKEDFNRLHGELERYFNFTSEHIVRDYEVPCKKIKAALTECLTSKIEKPLSCGEEVSNFVSCLLKCRPTQNVGYY